MSNVHLFRRRGSAGGDHVTFIELFFDLVFVFTIIQLSHTLADHYSPRGFLEGIMLVLAIWWVWIFTTWVTNWLNPEHWIGRCLLLGLMLIGLLLSTSIPEAFGERGLIFGIAFATNRSMLARKEDLRVQALSLSSVRRDFGPQLALTLGYVFDTARGSPDSSSGSAAFSTSQILPTGAVLSLDASSDAAASEGESALYDSLISVHLVQPLLRGGGHAVTHEPLIQAERNLVYALRDFELFREDFSIDVARRYYDLVNQKQTIENQRRNLESNEFARRKADALFAVGRTSELDVLRARREELNAQNDLLEAEEGLKLALDNFRIFLGLHEEEPVDVLSDSPPFTAVSYEIDSAVEVALANRLDFLNRREQLEDVRQRKDGALAGPELVVHARDEVIVLGIVDREAVGLR